MIHIQSGKKVISIILSFVMWFQFATYADAQPQIQSPSAILMECSTGKIIYEYNASERRSPASITKIMTLLLTFEAIEKGKVNLTDQVLTSEYASSMGGSQVFLAQGEVQTLETMIKCIVIASGNDASVAVAEHVAGSETAFVKMMNEKAVSLGMMDTHFEDCCGLSDSDEHYTSALDVAIMSRELVSRYPQIFEYSKIWMEDIIHETKQGSSIFTLSSTNKLLKQYQYATGLKTGSTQKAKFCLSATASKDGVDLIAVIMGAPDKNIRLSDAQALLTYGFGVCRFYVDENKEKLNDIKVKGAVEKYVQVTYEKEFRYLDIDGKDLNSVEKRVELPECLNAPISKGQEIGKATYHLNGIEIGKTPIVAAEDILKAGYLNYLQMLLLKYLL